MPSRYESGLNRLKELQKRENELKNGIAECDKFVRLIQAKPTPRKDGTVGKPWINIQVNDCYKDGDYWASAQLSFERDNLGQNIIDMFVNLAEARKAELTVKLNNMPKA